MTSPDEACAQLDAGTPVCDAGSCVECTQLRPEACDGVTPVCGQDNGCTACTEHDQCAGTACHLDGELRGACFEASEVVMVANNAELAAAIATIGNDSGVIVLEGATGYNQTVNIAGNVEIAFVGPLTAVLSGTAGLPSLNVGGDAIVYLAGPSVANGDADGLSCSGTSVWLDDSEVRNNADLGMDVSGGCAAHLRRTVISTNTGGGLSISGGELTTRNVVIGRNGDNLSSTVGGVRLDGTIAEIVYSVIVGNEATNAARGSLFCVGGENGSIRNSIITGGGNSISGCDTVTFETNAVDEPALAGSNLDVGPVMAEWFLNLGANDYHLTPAGEAALMDIAMWQPGDPTADIDGDPIPTDLPSFPGYDQP